MRKARQSGFERLENQLVKIIQEKGADQNPTGGVRVLLAVLKAFSLLFAGVVALRYLLYRCGLKRRYPLGVQVISIGNVTAGGTGKTPVTEIFARTLAAEGRKVAILSRGYRRKEAPWWQRVFTQVIDPPLVVSDGKRVLLDSATGGDEPCCTAGSHYLSILYTGSTVYMCQSQAPNFSYPPLYSLVSISPILAGCNLSDVFFLFDNQETRQVLSFQYPITVATNGIPCIFLSRWIDRVNSFSIFGG